MASVLVVDDDADAAEALCRFLRKAGHTVECVANGREALASILTTTPNAVILDLAMPEMDGARFLEVLRSYLRLQSLPVVLWTALPNSPILDKARRHGVAAVHLKPSASYKDILRSIEQAMTGPPN